MKDLGMFGPELKARRVGVLTDVQHLQEVSSAHCHSDRLTDKALTGQQPRAINEEGDQLGECPSSQEADHQEF